MIDVEASGSHIEGDRAPANVIEVMLGEPFRIPDSFQIDQANVVDTVTEIGSIDLDINGLGRKGKLRVLRVLDDGDWLGPIRTPLGPIKSVQVRENDTVSQDLDTSPLMAEIEMTNIEGRVFDTIKCTLQAGDAMYEVRVDKWRTEENEEGGVNFALSEFVDEEGERCSVWFPQDPEAQSLKDGLQFTLTI